MKKITGIIIIIAAFLLAFVAIPAWFDDTDLNEYCSQNLIVSEQIINNLVNESQCTLRDMVRVAPKETPWLAKSTRVLDKKEEVNGYIDSLLNDIAVGKTVSIKSYNKAKGASISLRDFILKTITDSHDSKAYDSILPAIAPINIGNTSQTNVLLSVLKQLNTRNTSALVGYCQDKFGCFRAGLPGRRYILAIEPTIVKLGESVKGKIRLGTIVYPEDRASVFVTNILQKKGDMVCYYAETAKTVGVTPIYIKALRPDPYTGEIVTACDTFYYQVQH
ncbi:MAG: hypothetical protein RI894_2168 [Bacteroidota bacterium]|jgi:hypothetical protein